MNTETVTTTTSRSVCSKCGIIEKSGKTSCCGLGGSWFRKCGSAGNTILRHTWNEGILACKTRTRLKTVTSRQAKPSYRIDTGNSKAVFTAAETFMFPSVNASTPIPTVNISITTLAKTSAKYNTETTTYKTTITSVTASDNDFQTPTRR